MGRCENHDSFVKYIDKIESSLSEKIKIVDDRVDNVFSKIDELREDLNEQAGEHRETEVHMTNMYKRFDELATQMQLVVTKLDTYIIALTTLQSETQHNSKFNKRGKDLIYEIVKWLVLLGLGMLITTKDVY